MNPQMRMVVMLAVAWVAGTLLFAAESPSTRAPADATQTPAQPPAPAPQTPATTGPAANTPPAPAPEPAAENAGEKPKPDAEAKPAAESKPASGEVEDDAEGPPPPPPANSGARSASPQRFVPSEQVRADFDVSFPIDI